MKTLRSIISFVKWRFVPFRYLTRLKHMRFHHLFDKKPNPKTKLGKEVQEMGFATGPSANEELVAQLQDIYFSRKPKQKPENLKAPFVNLVKPEDFVADHPLMQFAFSAEVLDVAIDYFDGHCRLDSIQVLHSFETEPNALKESQKWHLDYGDSRSFHCVMYLNDVEVEDDGPFVFVSKKDTKRFGKSLIVRRIEDATFAKELGDGDIITLYGKAGSSILIDPSICYHYGSRCKTARVAVFVTFNSDIPFLNAMPLIRENNQKIIALAKKIRPDLDAAIFDDMLDV